MMVLRSSLLFKYIAIAFAFVFLTAFTVGENIKLNQVYNGRASKNFWGRSNVLFQIPKGTVGEVLEHRRLPSGNYGLKIKLQGNFSTNEVWVYDWANRDNDIKLCADESCAVEVETPEEAAVAETLEETDAQRDPDAMEEADNSTDNENTEQNVTPGETDVDINTRFSHRMTEAMANCDVCEEISVTDYNTRLMQIASQLQAQDSEHICGIPVQGSLQITSNYGNRRHPTLGYRRRHAGVDFRAREGSPIYAAMSGVISFAGRAGGAGNTVKISHDNEALNGETRYAHLAHRCEVSVQVGQQVQRGQQIGCAGSTGTVTGPHLHFEVLRDGRAINPMRVCTTW